MSAIHDRMLQMVKVHCPGAVDGVMRLELLNAVEEACRLGHIWSEDTPFPLQSGVLAIPIDVADTDIVELISVSHPTMDLRPLTFTNDVLFLPRIPRPEEVGVTPLKVKLILSPQMISDLSTPEAWIPEDLWAMHYSLIMDGVIAKLASQASKPYTNSAKVSLHGRRFHNGIAMAYSNGKRGKILGAQSWRFPKF